MCYDLPLKVGATYVPVNRSLGMDYNGVTLNDWYLETYISVGFILQKFDYNEKQIYSHFGYNYL